MVSKKNRRLKRAIDATRRFATSVVRSVMAKQNSHGTEYALQLYSVPQNTSFTFFANAYKTLKLLDTFMYSEFPFNNPNQTDAILQYRNEYGDSDMHPYRYYYVLFAADSSTYRDPVLYTRDMKDSNEALARISSAKTQAIVVGNERLFNAAYATVISSNQTIDEIISKINGHLSNAHIDEYKTEKPSPSLKFYPSSVPAYNKVIPPAPTFENDRDGLVPFSTHTDPTPSNDEAYVESSDVEKGLPGVTISSDAPLTYEDTSNDDYLSPSVGKNEPHKQFANINIPSQRKGNTQRTTEPAHSTSIPPTLPQDDYSEHASTIRATTAVPEPKMRKTSKIMPSNVNKPAIAANQIPLSRATIINSPRSSVKHFGSGRIDSGFSTTAFHISPSLEGSPTAEITRHHTYNTPRSQATLLSVRPAVRTNMRGRPLRHRLLLMNTSTDASATAVIWSPSSTAVFTTVPPNVFSHAVNDTASHSKSAVRKEESEVRKQFSVVREPAEPPRETSYLGNVEDLKINLRNGNTEEAIVGNPSLSGRGETLSSSSLFFSKVSETEAISESFDGGAVADTSTDNHASHSGGRILPNMIKERVRISSTESDSDHVNGRRDFDPQAQSEEAESSNGSASTAVQTVIEGEHHSHIPEKVGSAALDKSSSFTTLPSGRENPSPRNLPERHPTPIFVQSKDSFWLPGTFGTVVSTIPKTQMQEKPIADIESAAESSRSDMEDNVGMTLTSSDDRSSSEDSLLIYTSTTSMPKGVGFVDSSLQFPDITGMEGMNVGEANPVEFSGEPSSSQERDAESGMTERSEEDFEGSDGTSSREYSREHQSSESATAWTTTSEPTLKTDPKTDYSGWIPEKVSSASSPQPTGGSSSSSGENESSLEFDGAMENRMTPNRFSVEAENGGADVTSLTTPSPSELLEASKSVAMESKVSKSTPQETATPQHPGTSFRVVGGGRKHPHGTTRYITTTLGPGNREQQFDREQDEVLTSTGGPITEELNTSSGDGDEEFTGEPDYDGSFPFTVVNGNQHGRKQELVPNDVVSTLATNFFSLVGEITSATQLQQTTEDTATATVEHTSVSAATPHIFEVSKALEYSVENIGSFTVSAPATSVVTETPSKIISEGVRSDFISNHDSNESSPSLNGESIRSREEITAETRSFDVKGANEITFVNIPPTSGEFFEMPEIEPTEPLVNVENRHAFIEAGHRTMRVWPSGKIVSETTSQTSAAFRTLEDLRSTLQRGATIRREESSTRDSYSHFIETTSQTSLLSFSDGTTGTLQGSLSDDMVTRSFDKKPVSKNSERLNKKAEHANAEGKSSSILTNGTSTYVSRRLSDGTPNSADRTKFRMASSLSHRGKNVFDNAEITHREDTTLATLPGQPTELIISSTFQPLPIVEPVRRSEESRFDEDVHQNVDQSFIDEQSSSDNDADRVVTQITPTISTKRFDGNENDPDFTTTSTESIVGPSNGYHGSDVITSSSSPMNSDEYTIFVTRNAENISQTAEYEHTRSLNSQQSTIGTSKGINEAFRSSDLNMGNDELIRSNDGERVLAHSTSSSFGHSNVKFSESIDSRAIHNIANDETISVANDFGKQTSTFDERTAKENSSLLRDRAAAAAEHDVTKEDGITRTSFTDANNPFLHPSESSLHKLNMMKTHGRVEDSENVVRSSTFGETTGEFVGKSSSSSEADVKTDVANFSPRSTTRKHAKSEEETRPSSEIMTSLEQPLQFNVRSYTTSVSTELDSEEVFEKSVPIIDSRTLNVFASSVSPAAEILEDFTRTSRRSPSINVFGDNSGASSSSVESLANSLSERMLSERQDTFSEGVTSTQQYSISISLPAESVYPCVADMI
uniref:Uncharacterized protein n=1 Tax=Parascaris univalens TaxID=6257 RepID=A0A915AND2_PARUN